MFLKHSQIELARASALLASAVAAARAIPPAFPLAATVAVNPFLGQSGEDLATASARLSRVAGVRMTRKRAEYRADVAAGRLNEADIEYALEACASPLKPADLAGVKAALAEDGQEPEPLPTVATLATQTTGTDWQTVIARSFGLWAAGHFDQGQALWTPAPGRSAFAAWREWAMHDLTPEIAGLKGFCAHVADAPDTAERAILRAAETLGIVDDAAETAFHRALMDVGGWAQHARWLLLQAELAGGTDATLTDLLAIRLIWEEALLAFTPELSDAWAEVVTEHARPIAPTPDMVVDAVLQEASERGHQRRLHACLKGMAGSGDRPSLQAAFCIDVRSEVFRRALESLDPGVETIGFAGFYGLALSHRAHGSDVAEAHLPVLLAPTLASSSHGADAAEQDVRIAARAARAWGRFRQAAVSSFAFVEAAGPFYGIKLLKDALGYGATTGPRSEGPPPRLETRLSKEEKAAAAASILKAMSMTSGHARIVLLLGHGARVTNNAHESAYHCGACGGHSGEVSARILAALLNDAETRAGLGPHGIDLACDTRFVAGLHDTATDAVTLFVDGPAPDHADGLARARILLERAGALARMERAPRLPGASGTSIAERARNWAEVRPEWGLARCAAFIAAPRSATAGAPLDGRSFLHSYDWRADSGFGTLELILTAPVVVASWISLQYYGSSVAPRVFGGGNKLIHNVTGGIGVVEGNGGRLRPGLPWQAVHDGAALAHEPLRLSVFIEAPRDAISAVLDRHAEVRALFDNGWLHLFALERGAVVARYRPGLRWEAEGSAGLPA